MSKEKIIKKTNYSTVPLFLFVIIFFIFTSLISIFILDVENFYASDSKQISKKKTFTNFLCFKTYN